MRKHTDQITKKETVETIIRNGIFTTEPEPHFSHLGCDTCPAPRLGATVYSGQGFLNLAAREQEQFEKEDHYAGECLPDSQHFVGNIADKV
jgi:hypothetical protein